MSYDLSYLPAKFNTLQAQKMLSAIQHQEDPAMRRRQWPTGPARGLWQFEAGGGVAGVLTHPASRTHALAACEKAGVRPTTAAVWATLQHDDKLAAAFARLLLFTDAAALPAIGDEEGAWAYYLRNWRPGAYTRGNAAQRAALRRKWSKSYAA